jgi:predicted DsbA family dithiol-disulfide isomerase
VEVEWLAFELHPGVPPEGQELPERFRQSGGRSHFQELAEEAGLEVGKRTHWYDSTPAHEATRWAAEHGAEDAFRHAIFRAYFVQNRNIGSAEVLAEIATDLELDADELRNALAEGRYRERIQQEYQSAREIGVTAVPTFVANQRYALVGAHPYEHFEKLMAEIQEPPRD